MSNTLFYMWEGHRQSLMAEHCFYVEQAIKRLLSQFSDIESEADRAAENYLEKTANNFDPDRHDPSDFYEAAHDEGCEFYRLLSDMHEHTRLSVAAGMYQEWDKQLRNWLTKEIIHWHVGDNLLKATWKASFDGIMDLLGALGWTVKQAPYFPKLDALHLAVNIFKHGEGDSLTYLKERYPAYLENQFADLNIESFSDHTNLKITDEQIEAFSTAILAFWQDVPERIFDDNPCDAPFPEWFERAWKKDHQREEKV